MIVDIGINSYPLFLEDQGLAETRIPDLHNAIDLLHNAVGKMDRHNLTIMWTKFTGLMEAVAEYADKNPGLNNYRDYRP